MKMWKTVIADDHPIARAGMRMLLDSSHDFTVIGESCSGQQTISMCSQLQPELVLIDISMPNGSGITATQILHSQFPDMVIIGVSGFSHAKVEQEIIRAGAVGYISKHTDFEKMISVIRSFMIPYYNYSASPMAEADFSLTSSEHKILMMLAEGYNRHEIAAHLQVSYNTVKMHLRNLYSKIEVSSSEEAVMFALKHYVIS